MLSSGASRSPSSDSASDDAPRRSTAWPRQCSLFRPADAGRAAVLGLADWRAPPLLSEVATTTGDHAEVVQGALRGADTHHRNVGTLGDGIGYTVVVVLPDFGPVAPAARWATPNPGLAALRTRAGAQASQARRTQVASDPLATVVGCAAAATGADFLYRRDPALVLAVMGACTTQAGAAPRGPV
jgi:hypothetical protein